MRTAVNVCHLPTYSGNFHYSVPYTIRTVQTEQHWLYWIISRYRIIKTQNWENRKYFQKIKIKWFIWEVNNLCQFLYNLIVHLYKFFDHRMMWKNGEMRCIFLKISTRMLEGAPNPFLIVLCSDFPPAEHKRDKEAKWNGGRKNSHTGCVAFGGTHQYFRQMNRNM